MTTKEKILDAAIDLFSQKGYREISVREIAKAVGIKASSLYKHYENKESILESIFAMFKEKISLTALPSEELERYVSGVTPEQYLNDAFELFKSVMWSPETVKISKIITIEQQRNRSVREFFLREIIEKPTRMMKDALDLMKKGVAPVRF
jgi:AcrR family transcriptional regulator